MANDNDGGERLLIFGHKSGSRNQVVGRMLAERMVHFFIIWLELVGELPKSIQIPLCQFLGGHHRHGFEIFPRSLSSLRFCRVIWHFFRGFQDFRRLVLGCMDSYDSESRRIFQHFSRSTRCAFFCTAPNSEIYGVANIFIKFFVVDNIHQNLLNFAILSQDSSFFATILMEICRKFAGFSQS